MAHHVDASEESNWLRPPDPGEVRVAVTYGEGTQLTAEVRQALDDLARALQQDEVEAYAGPHGVRGEKPCSALRWCTPQSCAPRALCESRGTCSKMECYLGTSIR